jgi:hypothetical protein
MGWERWLASLRGERERKKGKSGPGGENWLGKHFVISKSLVLILDLI